MSRLEFDPKNMRAPQGVPVGPFGCRACFIRQKPESTPFTLTIHDWIPRLSAFRLLLSVRPSLFQAQ
jgi:hypothetical protein